jgi:hypothetical protein
MTPAEGSPLPQFRTCRRRSGDGPFSKIPRASWLFNTVGVNAQTQVVVTPPGEAAETMGLNFAGEVVSSSTTDADDSNGALDLRVQSAIWYGPEPLPPSGRAAELTRLLANQGISYRVVTP